MTSPPSTPANDEPDRKCLCHHRTVRTKGALSPTTAKRMVFKLITAAAKTWRRRKGENQLLKVVRGVKFVDGVAFSEPTAQHAA